MTNYATRLWELLGKVKARPEGLRLDPMKGWWSAGVVSCSVSRPNASAILRDAARRLCDEHGIEIEIYEDEDGDFFVIRRGSDINFAEDADDYESALIEGLEWIIEQEVSE